MEYENLFQHPHQMLANILDFCSIPRSNIDLDQIIENQSICKLKPVTQSQELRKGGVGHGENELRPDTVTELRQYQQMLNMTWKSDMERSLTTAM